MRMLTAAYWSELWTDIHCRVIGHTWGAWRDGGQGQYWRQCQDCLRFESMPYIEMLMAQRRERRQERARRGER